MTTNGSAPASPPAPSSPPAPASPSAATHLLDARGLSKSFTTRRNLLGRPTESVHAVKEVSLRLRPGETLGLVGESGSGKSTVGRLIARLIEPDDGVVHLDGVDISAMRGSELRRARRDVQMVFQDPFSSLDPSWMVADIVTEGLKALRLQDRSQRERRAAELLDLVGLGSHVLRRYPYEFSGGQRQRIAIARALALDPKLLICDEAVSALDVSTQASIITKFEDLQAELGLSYLFISHDLSVVRHMSHHIAVMYLGRIVELGNAGTIYDTPKHPYTQALLSAVPQVTTGGDRRERIVLTGELPSAANPPSGCVFHTRCPHVMDVCRVEVPPTTDVGGGTQVACHLFPPAASATITSRSRPSETAGP